MSDIRLTWDDPEETVLIVEFIGQFQWKDYFTAFEDAYAKISSKPHRCYIITDYTRGWANNAASAITNTKQIIANAPKNLRMGVVVTSKLANMIMEAFRRFDPSSANTVLTAPTLDDARRMIAEVRAKSRSRDTPAS